MAMTEIRVTVMAAEDLMKVGLLSKMSVYSLVWIDPAMKQQTRVHRNGGRNPEWNDELVFNLGGDVLLFPHSTITIQVVCQRKRKHKLLGTTYLPLAEIARIKAMKDDPEEYDSLQLQLTTPSGHVQGYVCLSISLIDRSERSSPSGAPVFSTQSAEPVMGYPVGLPPGMAYYNAMQFQPTPQETVHQQRASRGTAFQAGSSDSFPVPTPPAGAVLYNYSPRAPHEGSSPYTRTPQHPSVDIRTRRSRHGNTALALLGGALSGLILGDVLF